MTLAGLARQASAGVIVGISAVIYSLSYGALLFSGPLASQLAYGISVTLITAIVGALFGLLSEERSFISGPDSNTISVLASLFAVFGTMGFAGTAGLPPASLLKLALATVVLSSLLSAVVFFALARFRLADLVRYIPFSVMAGFLASTGWMMSSGALNIIAGMPLSIESLGSFISEPWRPQLYCGIAVVAALYLLNGRVPRALLIPGAMLIASLAIHLLLAGSFCAEQTCNRHDWLFDDVRRATWLAPWELKLTLADARLLMDYLPAMLVVSFVGLLSILLSLASLELSFQKEFDMNRVLRTHALTSVMSGALGGFVSIISIGRTRLNHEAGGGALSGVIAALICLAVLAGAEQAIGWVPRAALGGLVLYLGVDLLKHWLWDVRSTTTREEMAQIALILTLVANFGYLIGFMAGVIISCFIFVITYSRIPLAGVATDLSLFSSSVMRPQHEMDTLRKHGARTLLYRLKGYVFFGSASRIDTVFTALDTASIEGVVIDFTNVSGIDRSAIGVFQRILRRYHKSGIQFYFVYSDANRDNLATISADGVAARHLSYYPSLDHALETAEDEMIARHQNAVVHNACFGFLDNLAEEDLFMSYCELRQVEKGEALCRVGEYSNEVFFVARGSFDIVNDISSARRIRLAKLTRGAMAGEMAFYTGEARAASIIALEPSEVYVLHKSAMQRMRNEHAELANRFDVMVISKISESLRRTNRLLAALS